MYGVDDILDSLLDDLHDGAVLTAGEQRQWVTEGERGGDAGHPVGPMVFQRIKNNDDGRQFQITVVEFVSEQT